MFPRLDSKFFATDPWLPGDVLRPIKKPTPEELDDLFYSEEIQKTNTGGLRTWQLASFNEVLHMNAPSGHRYEDVDAPVAIYEDLLTLRAYSSRWNDPSKRQADEDNWHPICMDLPDHVASPPRFQAVAKGRQPMGSSEGGC